MTTSRRVLILVSLNLALLTGCATHRELDDLRSSGVILYPVAKVGDLFAFTGDAVRSLAILPFGAGVVELGELDPDDRAELGDLVFEVPRSALSKRQGIGFGVERRPVAGQAFPLLREVERLAQRSFHWFLTDQIGGVAEARRGGVILLNPQRMAEADVECQKFILLHEAGHHIYSHLELLDKGYSRQQLELDADAYAARTLLIAGYKPYEVVWIVMTSYSEKEPASETHPSARERIENIKHVIANP